MGLIDAGPRAQIDRMLGYYEPYATSHEALDADTGFHEEVRNVARALVDAVCAIARRPALRPGRRSPGAAPEVIPAHSGTRPRRRRAALQIFADGDPDGFRDDSPHLWIGYIF